MKRAVKAARNKQAKGAAASSRTRAASAKAKSAAAARSKARSASQPRSAKTTSTKTKSTKTKSTKTRSAQTRSTRTSAAKPASAKAVSPKAGAAAQSASQLIDQRIRELGGWRGETLARMRALILAADPGVIEEWKWDVPVWSHHGIVCTGEAYKKAVKFTFARGASLADPSRLFNSSLEGNTRRALDIHEGEEVDAAAFKALIKAAVAHNAMPGKKK